jgi:hypothetical protein
MTTQVTYNNSKNVDFEEATISALKKMFGYCKKSKKFYGEYDIDNNGKRVQVCPVKEYRNLIKTDDIFANAVKQDGEEAGIILFKNYMTKKTEKYIVLIQN